MRITLLVALLLSATLICNSCRKTSQVTSGYANNQMGITRGDDTFMSRYMGTSASVINRMRIPNVYGIFIAGQLSGDYMKDSGSIIPIHRYWQRATFANDTLSGLLSDSVSVNGVGLKLDTTYGWNANPPAYFFSYYIHHDDGTLWNENSLNHWSVPGNAVIPPIAADISGIFPSYTGILPDHISDSADLSFTFHSSEFESVDSVMVIIYADGDIWQSKLATAQNETVTVTSNILRVLHQGFKPNNQNGIIEIVAYNHSIQTFAGKQFAFVKLREYVKSFTFD